MPTITVKNIPTELYEKLKQAANSSHRSINSEIIACIEWVVCSQQLAPEIVLSNARKLRTRTASFPTTDDEFTRAKDTGRL